MKKIGSINGIILAVISIFGAFLLEGGSLKALFMLAPLLVVFGGTFAAVIIGFGVNKFLNIFPLMRMAYFPPEYDYNNVIDNFYELSIKARKDGLLTIDGELEKFNHYFPKKIIKYVIDGNDSEYVENIAYNEMKAMQERHQSNIFVFTKMGGYAPTMGILGTVMALVVTLANAGSDPNLLIKSIATAFIATLWGVFSANLIWLPISDRLKQCHLEEKQLMEISLEGALALQKGEVPTIIKARLTSMLPRKEQEDILSY
ncbi:MAG: flagellar motor protein [Ignavibacterium sp.]